MPIATVDPATGHTVRTFTPHDPAFVEAALARAAEAAAAWRQVPPAERALVAAAVASDAGLVVVPRSAMPGDIPVAAVLRYTDDSTPKPQ